MSSAKKFYFTSLRDCLVFFYWLYKGNGHKKLSEVAENLYGRIKAYYDGTKLTSRNVKSALQEFFGNVDVFYKRLVNSGVPEKALSSSNSINRTAGTEEICNALLECLPKFLAAIYYLWYDVNATFEKLGGGGWKSDYPGGGTSWGGDLDKYFLSKKSNDYGGIIPGGFSSGEIRYGYYYDGYHQGFNMAPELGNILSKTTHNFFRDIFATSVISAYGTHKENIGNAVALVGTFCQIVEKDGGSVEKALVDEAKERNKCLQWTELKGHCKLLQQNFNKFFTAQRFSHTGESLGLDKLNREKFAVEAAKWLRDHLLEVKNHLKNIDTRDPVIDNPDKKHLGAYFTNNLFPYGFIFDDNHFGNMIKDPKALLQDHWRDALSNLLDESNGLAELKRILDGTNCPRQTVNKVEGAQNQGKKAEGTPNQRKKSEGAQNQGKDPNVDASSNTNVANSVTVSPSGAEGNAGPAGHTADGALVQVQAVQKTDPLESQPVPSPPSPDPYGSASERSPGLPGSIVSAQQSGVSPQAAVNQPSSAPGSESATSGSSSGRGPIGQPASSNAAQRSSQDTQATHDDASSTTTALGSGLSGAGAGGGGGPNEAQKKYPCSGGAVTKIGDYCVPNSAIERSKKLDSVLNNVKLRLDELRLQDELDAKLKKTQMVTNDTTTFPNEPLPHPPIQSSQPATHQPGPQLPPPPTYDLFVSGTEVEYPDASPLDGKAMPSFSQIKEIQRNQQRLSNEYKKIQEMYEKQQRELQELNEQSKKIFVKQEEFKHAVRNDAEHRKLFDDLKITIPPAPPTANFIATPSGYPLKPKKSPFNFPPATHKNFDGVLRSDPQGFVLTKTPRPTKPPLVVTPKVSPPPTGQLDDPPTESWADVSGAAIIDPLKKIPMAKDLDDLVFEVSERSLPTGEPISDPNKMTVTPLVTTTSKSIAPPLPTKIYSPHSGQFDDQHMGSIPDVEGTPITNKPNHIPTVYIPQDSAFETFVPSEPTGDPIADPKTKPPRKSLTPVEIEAHPGVMIDEPICQLYSPELVTKKVPGTDHSIPPPRTVREMLCWISDLPHALGYADLIKHIVNLFEGSESIEAIPQSISSDDVTEALSQSCSHASSVLAGIEGPVPIDLNKLHYERYGAPLMYYSEDPYTLLCQLLSYVYATYHQLSFLRTQCRRESHQGGWRDCQFGRNVLASEAWQCRNDPVDPMKLRGHGCNPSPLQGFLTDESYLSTYWYQRNDLCRRSRIKMGFLQKHLRDKHKHGFYIYNFLTGACYQNYDPLEKLCRYLVCLTRRTPRTTGELVSYFHHFGIELHEYALKSLSPLGTAITKPHSECPDWDHLGGADLNAVRSIRGSESLNRKSNSNHSNDHPRTLSTLVGCGSDSSNCQPRMSPITYRAYALYSQSFAHTYLSWAVYLPDRLHESLEKLHYDLLKHCGSGKCTSLHLCSTALPLLYTHGFTPPEGKSQVSLTCSDVIAKLKDIVNGKPIATLMTAMDNLLYGIREPFIFTLVALWSTALLVLANTMLYRLDVLYIRSHLIRTKASHHIDVKALLTKGRKMLSLYKDVDYFDDEPIGYIVV